jgi:hypothetical protein
MSRLPSIPLSQLVLLYVTGLALWTLFRAGRH